ARRRHAVRSGIETLAQRDRDLVVDPAMIWKPQPGIAVFGRNVHVRRTVGAFEILQAPGVGFADRHGRSIRLERRVYSRDPAAWAKARARRAVPTGRFQCREGRAGTLALCPLSGPRTPAHELKNLPRHRSMRRPESIPTRAPRP